MMRNAIQSDFRSSKMTGVGDYVKKVKVGHWRSNGEKCD